MSLMDRRAITARGTMLSTTPPWNSTAEPMRTLLVCIAFAACVACGNGVQKMNENVPVCTTLAECSAHDGERVHVVAVYTVWDPLPQRARNHPPAQQVMLVF